MKNVLKNQAGAVILVVILVIVLAAAGGGAAFLAVRMVVSGDGNFLQPFEDLGWIDPKDDDEDEDKDDDEDKDKDNDKKDTKKTSSSKKEYLVDETRLSADAKKSNVDHYYGDIALAEEMDDGEFGDLYKLIKAGINVYAKDGKAIEIEFGFDITEFCEEAYKQYKDEFAELGVTSSDGLVEMMMSMIETMFTEFDEEYSGYVSKYVDGGKFQLYVTEEGFEAIYETYDIEDGEDDIDTLIDALEDAFNTKISLVKD